MQQKQVNMKKNVLLCLGALLLTVGICSCSSDNEAADVFDESIPEEALNQTTTEFTGDEWFSANLHLWTQGYIQEGNLKVIRNALGAIESIDFTETPIEERPKTAADFYNRYYGEGVAECFKCIRHLEDRHVENEISVHDYYQQYYKDVIVKTEPQLIAFLNGQMVCGDCDYLPLKDFDVTPMFSKRGAIEIFKSFMKLDNYNENNCELQIVRVPEGDSFGPRLVYEVRKGLDGLVIDARSGRALYKTSYDYGM